MVRIFSCARFLAGSIALVAIGCRTPQHDPNAYQGVVEFEERHLGFESGGRLSSVSAVRGAHVAATDELARLDDALLRTSRAGRESEVEAANARVALLREGARPQDVRAMEAQIRAARANESIVEKELTREKSLLAQGSIAQATFDATESRLLALKSQREALEQQLSELRAGARKPEIDGAKAQASAATAASALESERMRKLVLHAPLAGTVLEVHAHEGEVVSAGAPVITIADTSHPYVDVFVPTSKLEGVRVGVRAAIRVDASADSFAGEVEDVSRRTEFTPRYIFSDRERANLVVRVRVRVADASGRIHAGVPAFVTLDLGPIAPAKGLGDASADAP